MFIKIISIKSINDDAQVSRSANDMMVAGKIEGLQGGITYQVKVKGELLTRWNSQKCQSGEIYQKEG